MRFSEMILLDSYRPRYISRKVSEEKKKKDKKTPELKYIIQSRLVRRLYEYVRDGVFKEEVALVEDSPRKAVNLSELVESVFGEFKGRDEVFEDFDIDLTDDGTLAYLRKFLADNPRSYGLPKSAKKNNNGKRNPEFLALKEAIKDLSEVRGGKATEMTQAIDKFLESLDEYARVFRGVKGLLPGQEVTEA